MRTFVKLREVLSSNRELAKQIAALEEKYAKHDFQFKAVFEAIKEIVSVHAIPRKRIIGLTNKDR